MLNKCSYFSHPAVINLSGHLVTTSNCVSTIQVPGQVLQLVFCSAVNNPFIDERAGSGLAST